MGIHKQNNSKKKKSIFLTSLQQFNDGFLNWFSEVCLSVYTGRYDNYTKPFEIDGTPLKYVVYGKVKDKVPQISDLDIQDTGFYAFKNLDDHIHIILGTYTIISTM